MKSSHFLAQLPLETKSNKKKLRKKANPTKAKKHIFNVKKQKNKFQQFANENIKVEI